MSGRRSNSLFSLTAWLKFLGIGSPAVLLVAAMSYFGFRVPIDQGQPANTRAETNSLVRIINAVREGLGGLASEETPTHVVHAHAVVPVKDSGKKPKERQEWFEPPPGSVVRLSPAHPKAAPPKPAPPVRPPPAEHARHKEKTKRNTVPDFNPY